MFNVVIPTTVFKLVILTCHLSLLSLLSKDSDELPDQRAWFCEHLLQHIDKSRVLDDFIQHLWIKAGSDQIVHAQICLLRWPWFWKITTDKNLITFLILWSCDSSDMWLVFHVTFHSLGKAATPLTDYDVWSFSHGTNLFECAIIFIPSKSPSELTWRIHFSWQELLIGHQVQIAIWPQDFVAPFSLRCKTV